MIRRFRTFCRNTFHKGRVDRELEEEIGSYLELVAADKTRHGTDAEQALREARRDLGGVEQVKESIRDIRVGAYVDPLMQDLRYAIRTLAKNPGFSLVAVLTLALGIGANTTMFTVVNSVLLKPLPYPEPDRLLMLWERQLSDGTPGTVAPANFADWRQQSDSFQEMAAVDPYPDFILNGYGGPQRLAGAAVSSDFFSLLGVRMALGRDFLSREDRPGQNQVVILSYSSWMKYFGGRPDIVGKHITLNNATYTVAGVLPRDFQFVSKASDFQSRNGFEVWTLLRLPSVMEPWQRGTHPLCVFARLKPGVTLNQAQAGLDHIARNLQRLYPDEDKERGITAIYLGEHVVGNLRTALYALLAAVSMVLLIACANIANLQLTRAASRQQEMLLRAALGASRRRLTQQLLTESVVLALLGGLLGFLLAFLGVPILVHQLPADLPRAAEIALDGRAMAFTTLISLVTGILFGLVPLFQSHRGGPSFTRGGRTATSQSPLRGALIVGQVAVALVLLIGAGLMTKSFWTLLRVSPGFQVEHILTARLSLPPQYLNNYKFGTGAHRRISAFQGALLERVRNIPGVQSAAFTAYLPLSGADNSWAFHIEGRPPNPPGVYSLANYRPVSADYFKTMAIPVERGRGFNASDNEDGRLVAAVNESMARAFWKEQNPIGQRVRFEERQWRTIVGVVGNVHHEGLGTRPEPELYIPYAQAPNVEARPTIVLRSSVEPGDLAGALRKAVSEADANVPLDQIASMKQIVSASVGQSRFRTAVLLLFALLALLMATIGLYGVMSYLVNQRIREFGIRMAVGASPGAIVQLVLGEAAKLAGIGIAIGSIGAVMLTRLIASLLYGVTPLDVATLISVPVLLAGVALLASYLPARRAAKADPMQSLRHE